MRARHETNAAACADDDFALVRCRLGGLADQPGRPVLRVPAGRTTTGVADLCGCGAVRQVVSGIEGLRLIDGAQPFAADY
jgi:hypothetical protein